MTAAATPLAAARLLDEAALHIGSTPGLSGVEDLARWLARTVVDLARPTGLDLLDTVCVASRESRRTGEGVVLAEAPTGYVMVVRYFPPGKPTPIHGHGGWGAVLVIKGRCRYETWEPAGDGVARLVDACDLGAGDTLGWAGPPRDVHRQVGLDDGGTELTVFQRHPFTTWAPHFRPAGEPARVPQPRTANG